jgi:exodeoxyribonuclease VII large subunit
MAQTELSFRPQQPSRGGPNVLTVGQLVRIAHGALDARFGTVWVEGEVSNLRVGAAGHAFFTLKDDEAMLPVAMWRSSLERLRFRIQDGQHLRVCGRVGIFARQGRFQMYADRAEPAGLGARMLELEQRKQKLAAEGLFEAARKRKLPRLPQVVGVITSAHGAALHDILQVAERRCPTRFVLAPAAVQGDEAPRALCRAVVRLQRIPEVDVIIIGRGGGSTEDLWAFNDERLARAIAASRVPIVSAVGHEVDVTICDLVADVRAATPSQAAELVVPDLAALRTAIDVRATRLRRALERHGLDRRARLDHVIVRLGACGRALPARARRVLLRLETVLAQQHPRARIHADRRRLVALRQRLFARGPELPTRADQRLRRADLRLRAAAATLVPSARAELAASTERLRTAGAQLPTRARLRLAQAVAALQALSPLAVLDRGYAVVTDEAGRVKTDAAGLSIGERIHVRLRHGIVHASVQSTAPDPPPPEPEDPPER